ncbi:peptidoglycan-binding protein [Garciella nitratireducens]|uniref:peptidoglycan-binding protein n=1 Tax=Garciella nitratireducens TaxID=218205 RepID=UPI001BD3623C|nr:peptidoglycan-binding protein [Garciella nitratireducens]
MDKKLLKQIGLYFITFVLFLGLSSTFTAKEFIGQPDKIKLDGPNMIEMQVALNNTHISLSPKGKDTTKKSHIKQQDQSKENSSQKNNKEVVYKKGDKGKEIMEYQEVLIQLGYLNGNPDGSFGDMMEWAISEFQKDEDLEQTGILNQETQKALKKVKNPEQNEIDQQEKKENETSKKDAIIEHIVKPGETFSHISAQYGVPIKDILEANSLSETSLIKDGQKLIIPQN